MASSQKKAQPRRPKTNWFLGCFGVASRSTSSDKKPRKSSSQKSLFSLCLPKLRITKNKYSSLDRKTAALKASQSILLEASKIKQHKLPNQHASNTLHESTEPPKSKKSYLLDTRSHNNQLDHDTSTIDGHEPEHRPKDGSSPKAKSRFWSSKASKDSMIGVWIMTVTLMIMSLWGKLCAILCMSAWFYCVPLFRGARDIHIPPDEDVKMDTLSIELGRNSDRYNKKVVLEGLLQRDHKLSRRWPRSS